MYYIEEMPNLLKKHDGTQKSYGTVTSLEKKKHLEITTDLMKTLTLAL